MGIAAYNRTSKVLSDQIAAPFVEQRKREDHLRAVLRSEELETYCLQAQIALVDAGGLVGMNIQQKLQKNGKRLQKLQAELLEAHIAWLDSSTLYPLTHLSVCLKKAEAAYRLLDHCCGDFKHPVEAPKGIAK